MALKLSIKALSSLTEAVWDSPLMERCISMWKETIPSTHQQCGITRRPALWQDVSMVSIHAAVFLSVTDSLISGISLLFLTQLLIVGLEYKDHEKETSKALNFRIFLCIYM